MSFLQIAKNAHLNEKIEKEKLEKYKKSCFFKEGEIYDILINKINNFKDDPTYLNDYMGVYFIGINNKGRLCFKPCLEHHLVYFTDPYESFIDIIKK